MLDLLNSDLLPRLSELNLSGTQPSKFEHASFYADPGLRRLRSTAARVGRSDVPFRCLPALREPGGTLAVRVQIPDTAVLASLDNPAFEKLRKAATLWRFTARTLSLSAEVEERLCGCFGDGLRIDYSALCHLA